MKVKNTKTNDRKRKDLEKHVSVNNKIKKAVYIFLLLLFIVVLIGISYGYVTKILEGTKQNKITAGILDLDLYEGEEVVIENLYPLAEQVGLIQEDSFDFKLINKTGNDTNYILKLQRVDTPDELNLTDVVYGLTKDNISSTGLLSELEEGDYIVDSGTIKGNQTINYELRFWLREDVEDDTTTNKKMLMYRVKADTSQYLTFNDFFKNKVDTKTTIDFSQISSETNGRGIYKYIEDGEDIYYWRGKVEDNHVVFANFCWEAVRTTSTGGLKMIYDGEVGKDGSCTNTGINSQLENTSAFNSSSNSPAYSGYMYGDVYKLLIKNAADMIGSYVYGNNIKWDGTRYTLTNTITSTGIYENDYSKIANSYHYTCFNENGICKTIYYIVAVTNKNLTYLTLDMGKTIDTAWSEMHQNKNSSLIKNAIDQWYKEKIANSIYSNNIEDTIYCNDRSVYDGDWGGWQLNNNAINNYLRYSSYNRNYINKRPNLNCSLKRDSFSVEETNFSNGKLTYPVGLITMDEVALSGGVQSATVNNDYFLYTGSYYWMLTPNYVAGAENYGYRVDANGSVYHEYSDQTRDKSGVRPVISLSPTALSTLSGTGTETDPYVVN